jgi:hypothetical protein
MTGKTVATSTTDQKAIADVQRYSEKKETDNGKK